MKRYAAYLRAVSPMNAKMPELKRAFMNLIERTFGKDVTTRTRETLIKVAR